MIKAMLPSIVCGKALVMVQCRVLDTIYMWYMDPGRFVAKRRIRSWKIVSVRSPREVVHNVKVHDVIIDQGPWVRSSEQSLSVYLVRTARNARETRVCDVVSERPVEEVWEAKMSVNHALSENRVVVDHYFLEFW